MLNLGWLSPNGELIKCDFMDHSKVADELVEKYKYPSTREDYYRSDDVLMRNGWVHITMSMFNHKLHIYWDKYLTDLQKIYLKPIFEDYKEDIDSIYIDCFEMEIGEKI